MRLVILILCLLMTLSCLAEQLNFSRKDHGKTTDFSYKWRDHQGVEQSLEFTLVKSAQSKLYSTTRAFRPQIAQQHVYKKLIKEARKIDPKKARINIQRVGKELRVNVSTQSPDTLKKWQMTMEEKKQEVRQEYLESNYYSDFETHLNQKGIKPDHVRYAADSIELLRPAAQAIYEKISEDSDSRSYVNLLVSWVQSIPYDTLENRLTSNGSGFSPPLQMLHNNLGDCDSKATMAAAMLRALLPKTNMIMVFLPDHALLGINLPKRDDEAFVRVGGVNYMLFDPTGPALMKLGEISPQVKGQISGRMYKTERVP